MIIFVNCKTGETYKAAPNLNQTQAVQFFFGANTSFRTFDRPRKTVQGEIRRSINPAELTSAHNSAVVRGLELVAMIDTNGR